MIRPISLFFFSVSLCENYSTKLSGLCNDR